MQDPVYQVLNKSESAASAVHSYSVKLAEELFLAALRKRKGRRSRILLFIPCLAIGGKGAFFIMPSISPSLCLASLLAAMGHSLPRRRRDLHVCACDPLHCR
jgi:hypothetical protein